MKVHWFTHASFKTTRSGFIQILHCSVPWKTTTLYFLAQTSYTMDKKNPWKSNFTFEWLGENSPNSSCQINFSLNFASLFIDAMRDSFSVLFQLKIYMIWTKEPIKVQNFRLSNAHLKLHQICTLIGRSLQVYKIPAKKVQRNFAS